MRANRCHATPRKRPDFVTGERTIILAHNTAPCRSNKQIDKSAANPLLDWCAQPSAAMKHFELNHVAIHVADVEKSCEFYRRGLLLAPMPRTAFTFPGGWFRL